MVRWCIDIVHISWCLYWKQVMYLSCAQMTCHGVQLAQTSSLHSTPLGYKGFVRLIIVLQWCKFCGFSIFGAHTPRKGWGSGKGSGQNGPTKEGMLCNRRPKELSQPSLTKRRLRGGFTLGYEICLWEGNLLREDSLSSRHILGSSQVEAWG